MKIETRLIEHGPAIERCNQRMLGKVRNAVVCPSGDEAARQQNAEPRVADARQSLGPGKAFALEVDLGLVLHLEPAVAQCLLDFDARTLAYGVEKRTPLIITELFNESGPLPGSRTLGSHRHLPTSMALLVGSLS
jgi:hypothetical protein